MIRVGVPGGANVTFEHATIDIGLDLHVVPEMTINSHDELDLDFDVSLHVRFDSPRYFVEGVTVRARSDLEVTTTQLRKVKLQEILRVGLPYGVWTGTEHGKWRTNQPTHVGGIYSNVQESNPLGRMVREEGPTPDALEWAAKIYNVATATAQPPAKAVMENLGIPLRTAGSWISKARGLGLITTPQTLDRDVTP